MPQITIDGKPCAYEGKKTILQVALDNGVEIPHYCYHPGMSVVASCRICLAEVAQPNPRNDNKVELIPKLMPTCQTPAVDGSQVHMTSPKALANQKTVMELLLINHPLDCPVCDQAGECYLQDYSYKYGRSQSRFEEDKIKQPKKDIGPNVLLYSDRCIMCTRCVRFTQEVTGTSEISIFGRGSSEQIDVFPGKPLDNELAGNVVDICPVGALLDKDFLMSMRVWNLTKTCTIDGITASGDNLSAETNDGKVYRLKPRVNMDVNQWWTSDEIRYGWKFAQSETRLIEPKTKEHNVPQAADWSAAYQAAIEGIQKAVHGSSEGSLMVMISPMLPCEEAYALGKLALRLDAQAVLAVGPVPVDGEDKTFPGGYTVRAEKAPNARGVRRALDRLTENVIGYEDIQAALDDDIIKAVILTGNYPSMWATPDLIQAVASKFVVLIDTLPNHLTNRVDVLLPSATWLEKAGTFENADNRLQTFEQAISVLEGARTEGQIALDLLATANGESRAIFEAQSMREQMGDAFTTQVHEPVIVEHEAEPDMQYVTL